MRVAPLVSWIGRPPLRFASSYNRSCASSLTASAGAERRNVTYKRHRLGADFGSLVATGENYYFGAGVMASGGTITRRMWLQQGTAGTWVQLTRGGALSWSVNGANYDTHCDPICSAAFGLSKFTRGEIYTLIAEDTIPAGQQLAVGEFSDAGYTEGRFFDPSVTTWDMNAGTVGTFTGTAPTTNMGAQVNLLGYPMALDIKSVGGCGDSIFAQGASTGYFSKMLIDNQIPGMQVGRSGGTWVPFYNDMRARHLFKYGTCVIEELGTNTITGQSLASSQSQVQQLWTALRGMAVTSPLGLQFKILRAPLLLKTTGTFTTTAGQTVTAGWGSGEIVEQFNDWLLTQVGVAGAIDSFPRIDLGATPIRASTTKGDVDYYKWATTPASITIDGTHPYTGAMSPINAVLLPAYNAL